MVLLCYSIYIMEYTSANTTTNIGEFHSNNDNETVLTSLQLLPGQSNFSILLDSSLYQTPIYTTVTQQPNVLQTPNQKKGFDSVTTFYLGALTVVGLLIVYRMTIKDRI